MADDLAWLFDDDRKTTAAGFEAWVDAPSPRDVVLSLEAADRRNRDQHVDSFLSEITHEQQKPPRSSVAASPVVAAIFAAFPGAKIVNVDVHDKRRKFLAMPKNVRVDL